MFGLKETSSSATEQWNEIISNKQSESNSSDKTEVKVTKVIDGDTLIIALDGEEEKAKLIGINTPETINPGKSVAYTGEQATDFTKELLEGEYIDIEFDKKTRDKYGRLLIYAYLKSGSFAGNMLQGVLIQKGLAMMMVAAPNIKYADYFNNLQSRAKESGMGLWESAKEKVGETSNKINIYIKKETPTLMGKAQKQFNKLESKFDRWKYNAKTNINMLIDSKKTIDHWLNLK